MADPSMLPPTVKNLELASLSLRRRRLETAPVAEIEFLVMPPAERSLRLVASNPEVEPAPPIIPAPASFSTVRRPLELSLVPEPELHRLPIVARPPDLALAPRVAVFCLPPVVRPVALSLAPAVEVYSLPLLTRPSALFRTPVIEVLNLPLVVRDAVLSLAPLVEVYPAPLALNSPDLRLAPSVDVFVLPSITLALELSLSPRMDVYPCPPRGCAPDLSLAPIQELLVLPLMVRENPDISLVPQNPVAEMAPVSPRLSDLSLVRKDTALSADVQISAPDLTLSEPSENEVPKKVLSRKSGPIGMGMGSSPGKPPLPPETDIPEHDVLELRESDIQLTPEEQEALAAGLPDPSDDKDRAQRLGEALSELQEAMDAAVMSGLVVEPEFKVLSDRFGARGVTSDSFLLNVQVYRKLV